MLDGECIWVLNDSWFRTKKKPLMGATIVAELFQARLGMRAHRRRDVVAD